MKRKDGEKTFERETDGFPQNNVMRGFSVYNSEGNVEYKTEVERMVYELRQELYPTQAPSPVLPVKENAEKKAAPRVAKTKRKAPVVLILIANVLLLAVIALSCFGIDKIVPFLAVFYKKSASVVMPVSVLDGLFSLAGLPSGLDYSINGDTSATVALIAFAAFGALLTVLSLWQVIAAIVSLARKQEKRRILFGVRAFLMLLCFVGVVLTVITLKAELGFGDLCSLLFPEVMGEYGLPRVSEGYVLYSGYGAYALIVLPIFTMICSSCIYKRKK